MGIVGIVGIVGGIVVGVTSEVGRGLKIPIMTPMTATATQMAMMHSLKPEDIVKCTQQSAH